MSHTQEQTTCFLCKPADDLVYARSEHATALCGIGPLSTGYTVLGAVSHSGCAAELSNAPRKDFVSFSRTIRDILTTKYGTTLVTEHGRYPVCNFINTVSAHCYHAHFLMFPGAPSVLESEPAAHFEAARAFESLEEALEYARDGSEYFLFSPSVDRFVVFTKPIKYVPQLARLLVATAIGSPDHSDWRKFPQREDAVREATALRERVRV